MEALSKKEYLRLKMPTEELPVSDQKRIALALNALGYEPVTFPLKVLHKLYPLCRDAGYDITIGIFPDLPREKYSVLKNSSLDGARILLLDRSRMEETAALAENIYCIQFASIPDLLLRMQAAKFIPHTDRARFPSVPA